LNVCDGGKLTCCMTGGNTVCAAPGTTFCTSKTMKDTSETIKRMRVLHFVLVHQNVYCVNLGDAIECFVN